MDLFTITPPPSKTAAQAIADDILASANHELQHRISAHRLNFQKLWKSQPVTPDEIIVELGADALKLLLASRENLENIGTLSALAGKTLEEVFPPEGWNPPRELSVVDGVVVIAPPADGFDAWGIAIPVAEESPVEPEPEIEP